MINKRLMPRILDQKIYDQLISEGFDPVIARVIAGRPLPKKGLEACLSPKLSHLDSPDLMKDMDKAADKLASVIQRIKAQESPGIMAGEIIGPEIIGIETDHDCDGQTSHAVIYTALTEIFGVHPKSIRSYIGHRMNEGYGLSQALMKRILEDEPRPTLLITADNGSSDEAQIKVLKEAGIEVIVTDHHYLPEDGPPKSAYAVLNPTQEGCGFPDALIAGCMVAWLLMAKVRSLLIARGSLLETSPSLKSLLDFVAVGTVADCVSMARSANNRAVVKYGLKLINQYKRPCWQALALLNAGNSRKIFKAEDLGFLIGPLLNSDGRLSDAFGSVSFLLAKDLAEAEPWVQQLSKQNQIRKGIQKNITEEALKAGEQQVQLGRVGLVIALDNGHAGVHGISASRIKDQFGRPTILFSMKEHEPELLSGSARSIDGVHLRNALARVKALSPDAIIKFGGHAGAAGLTIEVAKLGLFSELFEQAVLEQINLASVGPVIFTDGPLSEEHFSLSFVDELASLDPYGREFDAPIFEGEFLVQSLKWMGADQSHLSLNLILSASLDPNLKLNALNCPVRAVWFSADSWAKKLKSGDRIQAVFGLSDSEFRSTRELNVMIRHVEPVNFD
jgi:single-stranded-DNA-specific exonuclease